MKLYCGLWLPTLISSRTHRLGPYISPPFVQLRIEQNPPPPLALSPYLRYVLMKSSRSYNESGFPNENESGKSFPADLARMRSTIGAAVIGNLGTFVAFVFKEAGKPIGPILLRFWGTTMGKQVTCAIGLAVLVAVLCYYIFPIKADPDPQKAVLMESSKGLMAWLKREEEWYLDSKQYVIEEYGGKGKSMVSQRSSDRADGCSLLLPLPENDPFFHQKKMLLREKKLSINEQIHLSISPTYDWTSVNLSLLLRRARIIHLNEIELYFGEMNVESSSELYSPRNEVEALNFIIGCIDIAHGNCLLEKTALCDLRAATILRIHEFGRRNQLKTRVVESSCEKENALLQWAKHNGSKSKLQIAYIEGAGRGALASDDLDVGDIALEIPLSIIISDEVVRNSDMFHSLRKRGGISDETMLLLWSMRERHISNSEYKIYFDTLPENFNTGLSFGSDAISALEGTLVQKEISQAKENLRKEYAELFPVLCETYPKLFPPKSCTWEQYLWACELWRSNSMKIMYADGKVRTCLIPVAGFLNHSVVPHISHYGKVCRETKSVRFPLSRPCKAGEECYLGYGNLSSSQLLTSYGFLPQGGNPCDVIPLDSCDIGGVRGDTTHMVRGTWLSRNKDIFYYGLPTPLLEHIRNSLNSSTGTRTSLEKLAIELRVLEKISSIFKPMLERLGDPKLDDRENTNWDVMLAIEFKGLQRHIISSIVHSCAAGCQAVKNELQEKCMDENITARYVSSQL